MFEQLREIVGRFDRIEYMLTEPEVVADPARLRELMRERKSLEELSETYRLYEKTLLDKEKVEAELASFATDEDAELRLIAAEEKQEICDRLLELEQRLQILLLPKDPNDDRNVILEIRAGTGGEEAALFAADLYRMYCMYADHIGIRHTIAEENETELGGYKSVSVLLEGDGAYGTFKYEAGTHRVQRIPVTDSQGKLQTSAATVAVMPEAEEVDVQINPNDLEIDTMKSSGAGGQHINKTESAVRITHKPSGIVVECRSERSQLQNKDHALTILRSKLYELAQTKQQEEMASSRKSQVGSGDRSEKIRTYNYPQNRVTDHRIGLSLHSLDKILEGDLGELIDALKSAEQAEKMKNSQFAI